MPPKIFSFSREHRITKSNEISFILRSGVSVDADWLTLCVYKRKIKAAERNKVNNINRLGIVIKRRVFKGAIERNRFKRVVREFFRITVGQKNNGMDYVLVAQKRPELSDRHFLRKTIAGLFKQYSEKNYAD